MTLFQKTNFEIFERLQSGQPGQGQLQYAAAGLQLHGGLQVPSGYQIAAGAQMGGLTLEQLAALGGAVPRPRIVNLRHHPYQRN